MAKEKQSKVCETVGELKAFLEGIPNSMPIQGPFDDPMKFTIWDKSKGESGPRTYLAMDEA